MRGFPTAPPFCSISSTTVSASLLAIPLGKLSDTMGRKRILVTGYLAFSLVYFGFAFAQSDFVMILIFLLYGVYTAMVTGVERAYISEISRPEFKGTMLGLHSTIVGIALFPASLLAGLLWNYFGPQAPFIFGATLALLAAIVLACFMRKGPTNVRAITRVEHLVRSDGVVVPDELILLVS